MNSTASTRRSTNFAPPTCPPSTWMCCKDRLYILRPDDPARRAAQTVLYHMAETLAQLLAPMLSFTAEEIWQQLPDRDDSPACSYRIGRPCSRVGR